MGHDTHQRGGSSPSKAPWAVDERYQALLEAIPDLIFHINAKGTFLDYAPAKGVPLLIPPSDFLGRTVSEVLPPELAPRVMQYIEQALQTGETQALEYRIPVPMPDGDPRDYEARIAASGNDEVVAIVRDITRSRRAREALRESEAKYRQVFEHVHDVFYRLDMNGAVIDVSPSVQWWGYDPERLIGTPVADLYEDSEDRTALLNLLLEKGSIVDYEVRLKTADGRTMDASISSHLLRDGGGAVVAIEGIARDVTERRRAEKALRESEERFRTVVTNAPIILFAVDREGVLTLAEGKGLEALGWRAEEAVGRSIFDMYGNVPQVAENVRRALAGETFTATAEVQNMILEAYHAPIRDQEGRVVGMVAVATDVTERARAEKALRESEERFRRLAEDSIDGIALSEGLDIRFVNAALVKMLGYEREEEIVGRPFTDFVSPEHRELLAERGRARDKGQEVPDRYEFRALRRDGSEFDAEISVSIITHQGNQARLGLVTDITERKRAEQALRESEERFRKLAEDSIDGIVVAEDVEIRFANAALVEMLGCESDQEIVGRPFTDFVSPEHRELLAERGRARREGREAPSRYEFRGLRKDGTEFDAEASISRIAYLGRIAQQGVIRDISERKRAEQALRERERVLREVQAITHVGSWDIDLLTRDETLSDEMYAIYGIDKSADTLIESVMKLVHPDDVKAAHQAFEDAVKGKSRRLEYRIVRPDGEIRTVLTEGARLVRDGTGRPVRLVGATQDITERKRAEEALRQSEAKFRKLAESAAAAIFIYRGTRPLFANAAMEELTGYTQEEILARELWEFVHPDFQPLVRERSRARQQGAEAPSRYVFSIVRKSGEERWVDFTATMIEFEGEPAALGTAYDITERRRAENVLRESEGRYRLLAENVTDVIWTADLKLNLTFVSPSISQLTDYTAEEAMTLRLEDILTPGSLDSIKTVYEEEIAAPTLDQKDPSRSRTLELEVYRKDGATIWIEANMAFLRDTAGRPTGLLGVARDVTERKRAEEAAKKSQAKWLSLVENAPALIMTLDRDGTIQFANHAVTGAPLEEAIGSSIFRYAPPQYHEDMRAVFALVFKTGEIGGDFDVPWPESDGSTSWHTARVGPLKQDGEVVALTIIATDVTERRRAHDALRESEERFRRLSEATLEGIVIHEGGLLLDANQQAAAMLGYELPEIIGRDAFSFIAPEWHDLVRQHIASGYEEAYEVSFLGKDGTTLPAEVCGKTAFYRGRQVRVGTIRDISERKRAEEALQRERDELEARVERRMGRERRYKLTFRELTVLYLVAAGMADKEIAFRLGISHRTVSKHVENILSKMGAMSRTEAGVRAIREGLVETLK